MTHLNCTRWLTLLAATAMCAGTVWLPALARGAPASEDLVCHRLELRSNGEVQTWEENGVKVFVAPEGAQITQGPVRLCAPRMVVWFDRKESQKPEVRAATVTVYAEGVGRGGVEPDVPVNLIRGGKVTRHGAVFRSFRSRVAFLRDCPLSAPRGKKRPPLYARAVALTSGQTRPFTRKRLPELKVAPAIEEHTILAEETHAFYDKETQKATVVYLGDVRYTYGNLHLEADAAVVWIDTSEGKERREIYLQDNVRLSRSGEAPVPVEALELGQRFQSMRADQVFISPGRQRALALNAELRVNPKEGTQEDVFVLTGEEVYVLDSENLYVRKGSFTHCPFGHPHYRITGRRARVISQKPSVFLAAWDTRLELGKEGASTPLLPFIGADLTTDAFLLRRLSVGNSGRFGSFVKTTWMPGDLGLRLPSVEEWELNLDYYSDRGPAVGTQLEYHAGGQLGPTHTGDLMAYYVNDKAEEDSLDLAVPFQNRGRFHLRHRTRWSRHWRTDLEYYYLSDRGFRNEFFQDDFEREKPPESYASLRYLKNSTWAALTFKKQVNDFLTQVQESPVLEVCWVGVPFGRLIYEGGVQAGQYELERSKFSAQPDPPALLRAYTAHRMSVPFSLGSLRLDPFVDAVAGAAEEGAREGTSWSGATHRAGAGAGLNLSSTFQRSYELKSALLNLNRLRHVVIPHVRSETFSASGDGSEEFIQMDEVDAIDDRNQLSAGIRQRFQTKRGGPGKWRTVDLIELDTDYVHRSSDSVAFTGDRSFVELDLIVRPSDRLSLHSLDNRLSLSGKTNIYNLGLSLQASPATALTLDFDSISRISSCVSLDLVQRLSDRWYASFCEKYEFNSEGEGDNENLETRISLLRLFHKWRLDLGFEHDESHDDFAVTFRFAPIRSALDPLRSPM